MRESLSPVFSFTFTSPIVDSSSHNFQIFKITLTSVKIRMLKVCNGFVMIKKDSEREEKEVQIPIMNTTSVSLSVRDF